MPAASATIPMPDQPNPSKITALLGDLGLSGVPDLGQLAVMACCSSCRMTEKAPPRRPPWIEVLLQAVPDASADARPGAA